jgi:CheY-like chemotaxis protein
MNSPFDAHPNREVVSPEKTDRHEKRSVEKLSPPPMQSVNPADDNECAGKKMADDFQVPGLESLCSTAEEQKQAQQPAFVCGRMLVVDDLPVNRKLIGAQLQKLGYEVDQAENGLTALDKIRNEEYALVFMDLEMPVLDGFQSAIQVRQFDVENGLHTPIVAMSSRWGQVEVERCVSSGMDELISKGICLGELKELVSRRARRKPDKPAVQKAQSVVGETSVEIELQLLLDATHGKIDEQVIDLSVGAMKTFIGCLSCALEEKNMESVRYFAGAIKVPCNSLGLKSMTRLSQRILDDAAAGKWLTAEQGVRLLECQYRQILDQITGLTATLHRVDENSQG